MSNKILNAKTNRPIISAQTVQFYDGRNNIIDLSEQLPNATHCSIYCSTSEKKIMKKRTSSSQILNSPISNFQQHKQATGIAREYLANPRIKARIAEESERPIESNTQSTCAFASTSSTANNNIALQRPALELLDSPIFAHLSQLNLPRHGVDLRQAKGEGEVFLQTLVRQNLRKFTSKFRNLSIYRQFSADFLTVRLPFTLSWQLFKCLKI